ncbi:Structural maintenance of chromosomes protein 4, partial [Coemansia sp. RSA 2607]
ALARFEREEVQLQVNRKHVVGKAKKLRDAAEKDAHNTSQTRTTIAALEADAARGAAETADLEQRLEVERATLEEISDSLRGKTEALTAELAERQRELAPWREKIATHQSRLDIAQTELRLLDERAAAGGKLLEAAKHELRRLREVRVEKAQFAEARVEELAGVNDELEAADKAVQKAEGRVHVLRDAAAAARRSEEEARAALGATQAQSNVLKALLRQRDVGAIEGIHGRLGSLGAIDDAYDVAVSSACGGALDSIVVQTVRAGQQCVEYLRRNNVGRARFVILDTLRAPPAGPPRDTPEGVPRLYDLVRPADPCFAPAFYHAIGDTLVARDMEQARRVAYGRGKRFRVVSLDGAVLEAAGTMSGGGNRVARGAMSSRQATVDGGAVTEATVARLAAAREAADGECAEQQAALRTLQAKHKALQRRYDDLDALLPRLELELKAVDEQVQMAKKRARDLAAAQDQPVADDPASAERRAQIEARAAAETTAISELQAECATIDSAIAALQERIMQAGGIRLRAQKAKVDGLLERITTVADERVRWEASLAKARSDLARAERAAATRAAQLAELEEQLATVTAEIDAKSAASIELRGTADAARAAAETKREELDRVKDEFDARTAEANEVRAKEAALKRKLDDIERALADATRAVNYWSSEHDHLALHVIDEEDNIDNDGAADTAAAEDSDSDAMAVDVPPATLPRLTPDALDALDAAALEARIEQLEARLQRSRPNLSVLAEYARRAREFRARSSELETITAQRDAAQRELDGLRTRRLD